MHLPSARPRSIVFEYSGLMIPEYAVPNEDFYDYLSQLGFAISTLEQWLCAKAPLKRSEFPPRREDQGWHWMYVAYDPSGRCARP